MLTEPPIKKIDLHFPLGLEVTARNLRGVTIKDALDAIYKQYRKKVYDYHFLVAYPILSTLIWTMFSIVVNQVWMIANIQLGLILSMIWYSCVFETVTDEKCKQADDELENPVLAGFEWDKDESWTRLIVHCKKEGAPQPKKKGKKGQAEEDV
jgi:hypothetical protein